MAAAPARSGSTVGTASFATTKTRADNSDTAIAAVGLWQNFVDGKPAATDLIPAKAELKHWQEVLDGSGEKINGKWIWGEEHEKLIKQVAKLIQEGTEAINSNQTLAGICQI